MAMRCHLLSSHHIRRGQGRRDDVMWLAADRPALCPAHMLGEANRFFLTVHNSEPRCWDAAGWPASRPTMMGPAGGIIIVSAYDARRLGSLPRCPGQRKGRQDARRKEARCDSRIQHAVSLCTVAPHRRFAPVLQKRFALILQSDPAPKQPCCAIGHPRKGRPPRRPRRMEDRGGAGGVGAAGGGQAAPRAGAGGAVVGASDLQRRAMPQL